MNRFHDLEKNSIFHVSLHDIFGIGGIAEGAGAVAAAGVTSAAQITATGMTNASNEKIAAANNETAIKIHEADNAFNAEEAEKAREFNAAEAEKNREFNAAEAEKTREWNSEEAVMQRKLAAGLNPMFNGSSPAGGSGSSATASGSPASGPAASSAGAPNLVTPTMQTPDIAGAINAGVNLAKAKSEIDNNKAAAAKTLAETEHQTILNTLTPQTVKANLDKIIADTNLVYKKSAETNATIEYMQMQFDNLFMQGVSTYYNTLVNVEGFNLKVADVQSQFNLDVDKFHAEVNNFIADWERNHWSESYKYGKTNSRSKGWNFDAGVNAGNRQSSSESQSTITREGQSKRADGRSTSSMQQRSFGGVLGSILGVGGDVNGGYRDVTEDRETIQNTDFWKAGIEYQASLEIIKNPHKYSREAVHSATRRIKTIQMSAEGYQYFMLQMGKYKRMPSTWNQDLEAQQNYESLLPN